MVGKYNNSCVRYLGGLVTHGSFELLSWLSSFMILGAQL